MQIIKHTPDETFGGRWQFTWRRWYVIESLHGLLQCLMYIPSARCRWASGSRGWWVNGGCCMFLLHMFLTSSAVLETNISEGVIHLQYLHSHAIIPPISIIACSCKCSYLTLDTRKCEGMSHRHLIDLTGEKEVQWIIVVLVHMSCIKHTSTLPHSIFHLQKRHLSLVMGSPPMMRVKVLYSSKL